jgi:hypothetical protein
MSPDHESTVAAVKFIELAGPRRAPRVHRSVGRRRARFRAGIHCLQFL